jgi:hypothetical protein
VVPEPVDCAAAGRRKGERPRRAEMVSCRLTSVGRGSDRPVVSRLSRYRQRDEVLPVVGVLGFHGAPGQGGEEKRRQDGCGRASSKAHGGIFAGSISRCVAGRPAGANPQGSVRQPPRPGRSTRNLMARVPRSSTGIAGQLGARHGSQPRLRRRSRGNRLMKPPTLTRWSRGRTSARAQEGLSWRRQLVT